MDVKKAVGILKNNDCLILPCDTLYGLGGRAYSFEAVQKAYDIKKRPKEKKLPVHYYSLEQIEKDFILCEKAKILAEKFWPGALTIILNKKSDSKIAIDSYDVAIRIPNNKIILQLLKELGEPLFMPSANFSGEVPKKTFKEISESLGISGIEDDLNIAHFPSTIIDLKDGLKIIREGVISSKDIEKAIL